MKRFIHALLIVAVTVYLVVMLTRSHASAYAWLATFSPSAVFLAYLGVTHLAEHRRGPG